MFFFLAGGIGQQVRQVLKREVGRCINCGSSKVDLVEYEKVLKLFFVPVWRWSGKQPINYCNNCSLYFTPPHTHLLSNDDDDDDDDSVAPQQVRCRYCARGARGVDSDFKYCPFCGSSLL